MGRLLAPLLALVTAATSLVAVTGTPTPAHAAPLQGTTLITWNMQGENAGHISGGKWQNTVRPYMRQVPIMLLQEVGAGPPSSMENPDTRQPVPSIARTTADGHTYRNAVWNPEGRFRPRPYEVNFLQTDSNGGSDTGGRVNIAVITAQVPDEVRVVDNPIAAGRRALGVRFDNDWYFTFHGLSGGGGDSARMLDAIDDAVTAWGSADGRFYGWTVGGDFNTDPDTLGGRTDFPPNAAVYNTGQATHQGGGELDYAVSDHIINGLNARRLNGAGSDHYPVQVGGLRGAAESVELKVMPTGDSITGGVNHSTGDGYRGVLYADLLLTSLVAKRSLDFVGSRRSGDTTDRDHEGHPGKRIDEIARFTACSVEALRPNVVLLHAGTNDMNQNYQLDTAPMRLRGLINQVLADAPETTVLVATIIPSTKPGMQARIDRYNAAIPGVVQQLRAEGKRVRLVDAASALTHADVDGSHPHDGGYRKLSDVWLEALYAAADEGLLQKPVKGSGRDCSDPADPGAGNGIGPGWRALGTIAPGMGGPDGRIDLVELNGDQRADYIKIFPNGSVRAALNTKGNNGRPHWVDQGIIAPGVGQPGHTVRFADVNADGRDDYLVVGAQGSVWSFLNNRGSDGKFHWEKEGRIFPSYDGTKPVGDESGIESGWQREDVRFADVDGDGKADYLVVGPAGSMDAYIRAAPGQANNWFKVDTFATGTKAGPRARMRLGDVNGDGKADYLIVGSTGAVHAYINHMDGLSTGNWIEHQYFADESFHPDTAVAFRDVTGDGKADYLVVEGERIQAWENRGGNTTPSSGASGS
ncbi:FG-GAP-like repeat-containing protein [Streptomyces xantholiticus]|uniref:FG-GAP-like repeat-containing protein n=1 Tax=Streptomyces xantholiticus TaxID=68285 RepID=UPI00167B4CF1|nr:FG-GAP-like repeat-containing protein [Streptomyces xantholiticus]